MLVDNSTTFQSFERIKAEYSCAIRANARHW